jgi:CheY-like chemotaxis protein
MLFMGEVLKILLAEDNADDVFLLQQAIKKAGVPAHLNTAADGLEAIAYLKGEGIYADRDVHPFPDVLLLDLNMPRMNGFEVLESVRQDPVCSRLMVYILSASSRDADIQRAYDLRANSYIIKPSRLDELIGFVSALHQWHRFTSLPRVASAPSPLASTL